MDSNISINNDRLWDSLEQMAKIGPGIAGGNNRQSLTEDDNKGRKLLQKWCEDAGMKMKVDQRIAAKYGPAINKIAQRMKIKVKKGEIEKVKAARAARQAKQSEK